MARAATHIAKALSGRTRGALKRMRRTLGRGAATPTPAIICVQAELDRRSQRAARAPDAYAWARDAAAAIGMTLDAHAARDPGAWRSGFADYARVNPVPAPRADSVESIGAWLADRGLPAAATGARLALA